ncbi:MAG: hypothetical protein Q6373_018780 [Candidatus Sigynarchaeota archaeon]
MASRDRHGGAGKTEYRENIMEEIIKRYVVIVGKRPMTQIFHFTAGSAARDFAGKLASKGIKATIVVEAVS